MLYKNIKLPQNANISFPIQDIISIPKIYRFRKSKNNYENQNRHIAILTVLCEHAFLSIYCNTKLGFLEHIGVKYRLVYLLEFPVVRYQNDVDV